MNTHAEAINERISTLAASIANRHLSEDPLVPISGSPYQPAPTGLSLIFAFEIESYNQEQQERIREVGKAAFAQAIRENPKLLMSAVLSEAREGRNYFEKTSDELLT